MTLTPTEIEGRLSSIQFMQTMALVGENPDNIGTEEDATLAGNILGLTYQIEDYIFQPELLGPLTLTRMNEMRNADLYELGYPAEQDGTLTFIVDFENPYEAVDRYEQAMWEDHRQEQQPEEPFIPREERELATYEELAFVSGIPLDEHYETEKELTEQFRSFKIAAEERAECDFPVNEDVILSGFDEVDGAHLSCTMGESEELSENPEGIYIPTKRRKLFHFSVKADVPEEVVEVAGKIVGTRQMSVTSEMAGIDQQEEVGRQATTVKLNDEYSRLGPDATLENICDRFYPIDSFTWSSTDIVFAYKYSKDLITTLLQTNLPFVGVLRHHLNLISSFEIEVRYNSYPQALGMMLVGFLPTECVSLLPNAGNDTFTLLPHSKLSAGYETVQELKVKHFMETNYLQLGTLAATTRHDIRIIAMVWNQLVVAAGMPNVLTAHIWVKPNLSTSTKTTYRTIVGERQSKGSAGEHEGILNTILNGVGAVGEALPLVSTIVKGVAGIVGLFDKPSVYLEEASVGLTDIPIKVCAMRQIKDQTGSFEGVMEPVTLRKYLSTPCRIRTIAWPAAGAVDTLLLSQEVSLAALPAYNPVAESAKAYTLWKGTLCYAFEIVGTRFHQGQLMVAVTYRNDQLVPTNAQARETYMFTVDIGTSNYFCMEVPQIYPHDWRSVRNEGTQYMTPIITVWVQNPLAAPSIVGNTVYVNMYFYVGGDFEFNGQKHKAEPTTEEAAWEMERISRRVYKAGDSDLLLYQRARAKGSMSVDASAQELYDDAMEKWTVSERMRLDHIQEQVDLGADRAETEARNQPNPRPQLATFVAFVRNMRKAQRDYAMTHSGAANLGTRQSMGAAGETHSQTGEKLCWKPFDHTVSSRLGGDITHIETYRRRGISIADMGIGFATSPKVRIAILPLYPTNTAAALASGDRFYNLITAGFRTGGGRWVIRTNINKMQSIRFVAQNRYINDAVSRDGSFIPVDDLFFVPRAENGVSEIVVNSEGFINIEVPMISNNPIMTLNGAFNLNRVMSVALYAIGIQGTPGFTCTIYYIPGDDERFYFMLPMVPGAFSLAERAEIDEEDANHQPITRRNPTAVSGVNFIRGNVRHVHLEMYGDGIPRITMTDSIETNSYGQTDEEAAALEVDEIPKAASGIGLWQSIGSRQMGVSRATLPPSGGFQAAFDAPINFAPGVGPTTTPEPESDDEEPDDILSDAGRFFRLKEELYEGEEILYSIGTLFGAEYFKHLDFVGKTHIRNVLLHSNRRSERNLMRGLEQYGTVTDFLHIDVPEDELQKRFWWTVQYHQHFGHFIQEVDPRYGKRQLGDRWFNMIKDCVASVKSAIPELSKIAPFIAKLEALGDTVENWSKKLWKSVKLIFDHVFPIVTALYTAFTAPVALSVVAVTQLCYHLYSLIPEGKEQDPDAQLPVDEEHFAENNPFAAPKPGQRQMGLFDAVLEGASALGGGLDGLVKVITTFGGGLVAAVSRSFGYAVGPGYARYMRRRKEEVGTETLFERCIRIFFDSVLYALYGNAMNIEWERKRILHVTEIVQKFQADELKGRFVGAQMDALSSSGMGTNLERLRWYYAEAKKAMYLEAELRLSPLVSRQIGKIYETLVQCERVKRTRTMQPEPVGIYIGGKPGTGKSLLVSNYLPRFLLNECDLPSGDACIYTIPTGEQEFWDNYNQQPYAFVDEFLQENKGQDALKVIQMISSSKWAINMASLDAKGMTFESRFIAACSNLTSVITATEIADQSALVRRFPFSYEIRVQDDYRKGEKLNYAKLIAEVDRCLNKDDFFALMDKVWHFHRLDLLTGKYEQVRNQDLPPLTFSKILTLLKEEYEMRTTAFDSMEAKITEIIAARQMKRMFGFGKQHTAEVSASCSLASTGCSARLDTASLEQEDEICNNNHVPLIKQELNKLCRAWHDGGKVESDFYRKVANEWVGDLTECSNLARWVREHGEPGEDDWKPFQDMVMAKVEERKRVFPPWIGFLGVLGAMGLSATAVYFTIKNARELLGGVQGVVQSYTGTTASRTSRLAKQVTKVAKAQHLQMGGDGSVAEKIRKNMRLFRSRWVEKGAMCTANVSGLWIDDRHCIIPAHFVDNHIKCKKEGKAIGTDMLNAAKGEALSWDTHVFHPCSFIPIKAGEYVDSYLYRTPCPIEAVRNILPLIMSEKAKVLDFAHNGSLLCGGEKCVSCSGDIDCSIGTYDDMYFKDESNKIHKTRTAIARLETRTIDGDCGRPYVLNASFNTPLVGIHSIYCSNGTAGMCIITREAVEEARKCFQEYYNDVCFEPEEVPIKIGDRNSRYWTSSTELVGKVEINGHKVVHNSPTASALVPLHFRGRRLEHEDWDVDFLPAAQRVLTTPEGIKVHPLITNAQKYDVKTRTIHGDNAMCQMIEHFTNKVPSSFGARILTYDEAINGTADGMVMPLKMDTSCGYWSEWFKDGKKQIFSECEDNVVGEKKRWEFSEKASSVVVPIWDCSFRDRLADCKAMLAEGTLPCHLWIATTKDELRPREKVIQGKTRVFEQPGMEYVILSRVYFGDFLGWYKNHAGFTLYHGIGKDKEEVWGAYLKGFSDCGARGHAFDYSNWDGSVPPQAFEFFLAVTDHFYEGCSEYARNIRHGIVRMLRDGLHVMNDQCYRTRQGNKSGNPFTDVFNSVCNTWVMYSAWMMTKVEAGLEPSLSDFDEKVRMLTYGDDLMMTVRPDALTFFTGPKIAEACDKLGLKITDAKKTGVIPDSIGFSEMTFLKSEFRACKTRHGLTVLAPMPERDILKELTYCPKSVQGNDEDLRQRVANTQRFMAHHGQAKLETFKGQLRELGIPKAWLNLDWDAFASELKEKQLNASIY